MRCLFLAGALSIAAAAGVTAKPILTSSEETFAQVCLDADRSLDRLIEACSAALTEPGLTRDQQADLTVALADVYSWKDDNAEARRIYEQALEIDPMNVDALNGLGWVVRVTDGDAAALELFDRSLAAGVTIQGLAGRASTGRETGAIDGETAREMLRAALAIDPSYTWAIREIAWSQHDEGLYNDAAATFREALDVNTTDDNAHYGLGRTLISIGDVDAALSHLDQVSPHASEHFAAQVYRIIGLRNADRNAQALREADRLIESYPASTSGYIEKGLALMALERRAEALGTFAEALDAVEPDNALLYWYADALTYDARFEEALAIIDRGLGLSGADHSDYLLKSYIALELQNYSLARSAAQSSLDTGYEDPWAHYYIAITLVHDGKVDAAIARFSAAMEGGLPEDRVGAFARELVGAGEYYQAAQLRLKY